MYSNITELKFQYVGFRLCGPSVTFAVFIKSLAMLINVVLPLSIRDFFFFILFQIEGFQEFEARRKKKFDKQIDSNVMIGSKGLDEGLDL